MNAFGQHHHVYVQAGSPLSELDDLVTVRPCNHSVAGHPLDGSGPDLPSAASAGNVVALRPSRRRPSGRKEAGDGAFETIGDCRHGWLTVLGRDGIFEIVSVARRMERDLVGSVERGACPKI
jgi:hypothetical protein